MYFKVTSIFSIILLLITGCATTGNLSGIKVVGLNDELENKVKVTTYDYTKPFLIVGGSQDWFFRGYLNKETKQASYQLYAIINSGRWMYWDTAKFKMSGKLKKYELSRVGSDVDCSKYGCAHYEDVILHLERDVLDDWKNANPVVRFSSSKVSGHRDINIDSKEVVEFLNKMDFVISKFNK